MRVLVTGGAGFIGSHIVEQLLALGHECVVVDDFSTGSPENLPADVPVFEIDLRDADAVRTVFEEVRPDVVSHQAAQMSVSLSVREPQFDASVNIMGLLNVLSESHRAGVRRLLFASSGGVLYGSVDAPAAEDAPLDPVSPYGISKWVGEKYLQFFAREHGLQTVALRYANVYGPRQNPHGEAGVVAIFCKRLLAGETATINGDGKYIRDYVYVTDVARAHTAAVLADLPRGFSAFNVGTGRGTDVNELGALIRSACRGTLSAAAGRPLEVPEFQYGPARPGDLRSNLVAPARAAAVLGWEPAVTLADGLPRTVRWFHDHALSAVRS